MGIVFVPIYIKYLGVEAYGLIGLYITMQAWIALLDMGMTPTLNREMARFRAGEHDQTWARRLLRTLECVYIVIVGVVIVTSLILSGPIANSWLRVEELSVPTVETVIVIMGFIISIRWFMSLYRGAIMGLQEQVWLNKVSVVFATIRGLGVIPILIFVSATVEAFFAFQAAVATAELIVFARRTGHLIPRSDEKINFDIQILKSVWNFAFGVFSVNILATILLQADKILISLMLPLRYLGLYTLATSICSAITSLSAPIINGVYPRLTELIANKEQTLLAVTYHKSAQLLAMVVVSTGLVVSIYSSELLMLWTRDAAIALAGAGVLTVYAIGTILNGLMSLPYTLQLSYGYTRLMVILNSILVITLVPMMYWSITVYGMVGPACVWVLLNTIYIVIGVPLIHERYLTQERRRWYLHGLIAPVLLIATVCIGFRWFLGPPNISNQIDNALILSGAFAIALMAASFSTPFGRNKIAEIHAVAMGRRSNDAKLPD